MARLLPTRAARWYAVPVSFLLLIKLALVVGAPPFMDEAYYWMWGQHLALSYFDHPPLVGWTEGLAGMAFGWNVVGLRIMVILTLLGDLYVLMLFAQRQRLEAWPERFWLSALLFLATPIFFAMSNVALPDHLLMFFSLLALYGLSGFAARWEANLPRAWPLLYLGAVALGLAMLSKYNGALIGVGFLIFIAVSPAHRRLFSNPHFCAAGAISLALQAPVLIWNVQHGFASFGFIFGGRHSVGDMLHFEGVAGFALAALALLSPLLLVGMARLLFARERGADVRLGRAIFWVSTLAVLVASLFVNVLFHWNLIAYVALLPFLAGRMRSPWLVVPQVIYGGIAALGALVNYAIIPVMALISYADQTSGWSYGWDEIAAHVQAAELTHPTQFIAATDYGLAASLGFALHDRDVTSLAPARDAFDDWFDAAAQRGHSAIIVADRWRPLGSGISARFSQITPLEDVEIWRFGKLIDVYVLYFAEDFAGNDAAPASPPS